MPSKLIVIVGYVNDPTETHPLVTYLVDEADGKRFSDTVNHRDMNQVRCYYNGVLSGWHLCRAGGVHNVLELTQRLCWPYATREFHQPQSFGSEDYRIADGVPANLL